MPQNRKETDSETSIIGAIGMLLACFVATVEFFKLLFEGKTKEEAEKTSKTLVIVTFVILVLFICVCIHSCFNSVK